MVYLKSSAISAVDYNERNLDLNVTFTSGGHVHLLRCASVEVLRPDHRFVGGAVLQRNIRDQHSSNRVMITSGAGRLRWSVGTTFFSVRVQNQLRTTESSDGPRRKCGRFVARRIA